MTLGDTAALCCFAPSRQLTDRDADGSLVFQEFAMAMAIVARHMAGLGWKMCHGANNISLAYLLVLICFDRARFDQNGKRFSATG
jgi:hypothetical protein